MKKIYIRFTVAAVLVSLMLVSCEKGFDSINKDPNAVTNVPSDYLLPGAIMSISNAENAYMESFAYASDWVQYTSSGYWADPGRYYFEKSRSFMWDQLYSGPLINLKVMNRQTTLEGNPTLHAASIILMSYTFAMLTDVYGPVPYTQALSAMDGINKPIFDDQELIYKALLDSLKVANTLLNGVTKMDVEPEYDVLCHGDASKWQKFANSLRLRILMRISAKVDVSSELRNLLSDNNSPILENISDNISFKYPGISPQNYFPLFDVLSEDASDGGYRISKTLADHLVQTQDPRLEVYALQNKKGEFAGLPNGQGATAGQIDDYSRVNTRYGQKNRAGIFISYSEVLFLLAEAADRNLITGDAEQYYNKAIKTNFEELGLTDQDYNTFISSSQAKFTDLDRILTQKWVSLFGRGLEAWTEYRRTGIPDLVPAAYAFVNVVPCRFLYPLTEEQTNNESLQKAITTLQKGDALDSKVWWMN